MSSPKTSPCNHSEVNNYANLYLLESNRYDSNADLDLLGTDTDFALFLSRQLQLAYRNNQDAIDCVDAYLQPTVRELLNLGIPRSQIGPMRKCTDSGKLVLSKCKEVAPEAFGDEAV